MIVLTLLVLLAVPAVQVLSTWPSSGPPVVAIVYAPLSQVDTLMPGVEVLETYDAFVLVRAPADRLARFAARGIFVEPQDAGNWIGLEPVQFDIRRGEPAIPPALRSGAEGTHHLVHFIGPIKSAWLEDLRHLGARVLHSVPTNAFLVEMDGAVREAARSLRFVDWIGPYHTAYKVHPDFAATQGIVTAQILTFYATDTDSVVAALSALGISKVTGTSSDSGILSVFHAGDLGVVRARFNAALVPDIARLREVLYVEPWRPNQLTNVNAQAFLQTGLAPTDPNARRLWDQGIRGQGEIVAIADTGIDFDSNFFRESSTIVQKGAVGDPTGTVGPESIYNTTDLTRRKLVRYLPMSVYRAVDPWTGGDPEAREDSINAGGCPSGHGTSVSGNVAGWDEGLGSSANDGMAPGAKIIVQDIGSVGPVTGCPGVGDNLAYVPDDFDDLFGSAFANGARIHTNSWGSDTGDYDLQAMMLDRFVWNNPDMAIFFAAGNSGPASSSIQTPGLAKSTITIGGANPFPSQETLNGQSSRGPTLDLRLKPDIITFFGGTTATSSGNPTDNANVFATTAFAGTSHATPLAAGMAALVRQYFVQGWYPSGAPLAASGFQPSAALVKAVLLSSSRKMNDATASAGNTYPNNAQGWGRLVLDDSLYLSAGTPDLQKLWVVDERTGLTTGDAIDYRIRLSSNATSLRIVLVWSDYPALPNASPAIVNNLNLLVVSPSSSAYKGNVFGTFAQAESIPNAGSFDARNTMEGVIVNTPAAGEWRIRVDGANAPVGPQPFALIAIGDLDLGYGDVLLNRKVYREADTVQVEVRDSNAASVSVNVRSSTEGAGEDVVLTSTAPGSGLWRGTIPIAFGTPAPDGTLQVSEGDAILSRYSDSAPVHIAVASATVDASPPEISNVHAREVTDSGATITWSTDELSSSIVRYGTSPASLGSSASMADRVTAHAIRLAGLSADTVYYYDVESIDPYAHVTRDSNGGSHYTFRTSAAGEVLLVIGETSFPEDRVAMYRDALSRSGWLFDEWVVPERGDPALATLQGYKAILWQVGLEQYPPLTDVQRGLLKSYLDGGGRLFLSSHDIAWAFCSQESNPYFTGPRCSWLGSVLKTVWQDDPTTWNMNRGIAGDPISGPYTGAVSYVGHRGGGHGDEVDNLCRTTTDTATCVRAGATTAYVWKDSEATVDHIAIRWNSTGPNGTVGVGVWGGTPSRAVAFYFEWSGLGFVSGVTTNSIRTDVLNRTIVWFIGRDHPAVRVSAPNGAETITTNTVQVNWTRTTSGAVVSSQTLYYSANSGEQWNFLGTAPPAATSFTWDVSSLANGGRYRVRVVVTDNGSPSLTGADASDTDFSIVRPGGDAVGPLIRPGSLLIASNPIVSGRPTTVRAIAEDGNRGNSPLAGAEVFVGLAPGPNGTGTPMSPADGSFNAATEGLVWVATATWPLGTTCFWVHANDTSGNWGPLAVRCTITISAAGLDTTPPISIASTRLDLLGATFNDVGVTWQRAADGGDVGGTYAYRVFRATSFSGPYTQVGAEHLEDGASTYTFVDFGAGDLSSSRTYFYFVQTVDLAGNVANGSQRAAKLSFDLPARAFYVSIPVLLTDSSPASVFRTASPRAAWTYDGCTDRWLSYSPSRETALNSLQAITTAQGLFVDMAAPDRLTVVGLVPTTTSVPLCVGWNLVGFPRFTSMTVDEVLTATGANAILEFNVAATPGQTRVMAGTDALQAGRAYWIRTAVATTWSVPSG